MSNTAKTDNIDEKTWEHHRARIESLYWGKSLSAIDAHMREHYAFVASKSQYERQFRKWQLRKNLTGPEWTVIIRYMKRNSIRLEQVEVLFKGHEIPHKRILQEIARRSSLNTTWQSGSYKLPKEITVRPRSRPPDIDAANGLQTTIVPAIIPSLSSIQTEASLELVTIPSISINRYSSNASTLAASWSAPFSWMRSVDLDSFSQNLSAAEQLTKWRKPPKAQLDALFYSKDRSFLDTRHESHETSVPLCAIASLANNLSSVDHNVSNDAYSLLKALPLNVVLQSLKVLPVPVLDALKEQVFATAVKVGDVNLVSAMLKLNADPRERIMIDRSTGSKPTYPLDYARDADHFAVAKTLISHMCQGATQSQLDGLIDYILYGMESTMPESRMYFTRWPIGRFGESKPIELMCIALAAGARPKWDCLRAVYDVILVASLKKLVENTTGGIMAWLEIGLLKFYLGSSYDWTKTSPIENVLQYVFSDCQRQLPRGDPKFRTVVLEGLKTAIVNKKEEAAKMILRAFSLLGYRLNSEETCMGNTATNDLIIQAFDNADWDLATSLMLAQYSTAVGGNLEQGLKATASTAYRSGAQQPVARSFEKPPHVPTYHEQFAGAVKEKNLVLADQLLQDHKLSSVYMKNFVKLAISLGEFDMIVSIIRSMKDVCSWSSGELYVLLDHGQITAVSALLIGNPVWKSALDAACYNGGFGTLEAMLFQGSELPFFDHFGDNNDFLIQEQQVYFRVIAFHAIATGNFKLCEWLLQIGMDADELHLCEMQNNDMAVVKAPVTYCSLAGGGGDLVRYSWCTIPSLLAVAAQHNHEDWMRHLLAQGIRSADSGALVWAVKTKATVATIRFLLREAEPGRYSGQRNYGIAALRQAIRSRDFTIIDVLCEAVNIDAIEPSTKEFSEHEAPLSPLGEAIILDDVEIVQFLLKRGANPNAYVSFDGQKMLKRIESHIQRVTPLLAAIDMQSLPLVKLLLEHGAEVDYKRNMGVFRTPLQRAAEMGCFDIVQCLIEQSAIIDTIPIHSGGTALQLAALKGFCGIAAFLLERGADPNHPPAKGDGRTAFEAAAEWGHVDTMSLLMQYNANLDLEVGEPPESQHERAKRFAEKNGFMASKRFVEHLYRQALGQENWDIGMALDWM